jgi:hypothetical protein
MHKRGRKRAGEKGREKEQGCSSYLFLICEEVLSSSLVKADREGVLEGVPTSKRGPRLNHLFFADDSLLFCRADMSHWSRLSNFLKNYEIASGQKLNSTKTAIFFSRNTPQETREKILEESRIPSSQRYDTYLGLPALVGKSQTKEFKSIIDKVWKRMQDWKLKFLSQAGQEILLKAVIQAIPTYCMSVFMLPKTLCSKINSLMQQFWWGASGIHWMRWSKMGIPKSKGGMGFRDFNYFNKALLAKQCWRLWSSPDGLVSQILRAKYYTNSTILEAKLGANLSYAWRSILGACDILKEGLFCRIGNGEKTRIWGDKWVPISTTYAIHSVPRELDGEAKVVELIDRDCLGWNRGKLDNLFHPKEVNAILKVPIRPHREDEIVWRDTPNGVFTVKSAYHGAMRRALQEQLKALQMALVMKCGKGYGNYIFPMQKKKTFYGRHVMTFYQRKRLFIGGR